MKDLREAINPETFELMVKEKNKYIEIIEKARKDNLFHGVKDGEFIKVDGYYITMNVASKSWYTIMDEQSYNNYAYILKRCVDVNVLTPDINNRTITVTHYSNTGFNENSYIKNNNGDIPAQYTFNYKGDRLIDAEYFELGNSIASIEEAWSTFSEMIKLENGNIQQSQQQIKELQKEMAKLEKDMNKSEEKIAFVQMQQGLLFSANDKRDVYMSDTFSITRRSMEYVNSVRKLYHLKNEKSEI